MTAEFTELNRIEEDKLLQHTTLYYIFVFVFVDNYHKQPQSKKPFL